MTKDWNAVEDVIKDLSWTQKKQLNEVRKIMERDHGFKASTRAFRMKLAEWGLTRKTPRKRAAEDDARTSEKRQKRNVEEQGARGAEGDESDSTVGEASQDRGDMRNTISRDLTPRDPENLETILLSRANAYTELSESTAIDTTLTIFDENGDLIPATFEASSHRHASEALTQPGTVSSTAIVMSMLQYVLEGDSQKLEALIMKHPSHINLPIGMPFDIARGRFFNHVAIAQCVILQHPDQTIFDIACALPSGPVIWILLAHGAKGSKHPFGTDLAFHNAIKNGRTYTVQALLLPGRSKLNGEPGVSWKPLLQAVYWNQPDIVRLLIGRGAGVNDTSPGTDGLMKSPLQFCLDRRAKDFRDIVVREKCDCILKMLLTAGANVMLHPTEGSAPTAFEVFLRPWQGDPNWIAKLNAVDTECLETFIKQGADLKTPFQGFVCTAQSSGTFEHQMLWHTTPTTARLLIDHADPTPNGNGANLLHEIVGNCPEAKRHPSDTLRDIEVLFKRGADPNHTDPSAFTPLRRCIERCPAVDIVPRLRLLLDAGADPELKHANRLPPFVLAARIFEEPIRSQIMDFLVAKIQGRQKRVVYEETFNWTDGYFPIPTAPSFAQVQWYNGSNADFNANVARMMPDDVHQPFQRACFGVVSMNYLNAATTRASLQRPLQMLNTEKDEMYQVVVQRQIARLPEYRFAQEFVMGLLKPSMAPVLADFSQGLEREGENVRKDRDEVMGPHQTPIESLKVPKAFANFATVSNMSSAFSPRYDDPALNTTTHSQQNSNSNFNALPSSRARAVSTSSTSSSASSACDLVPTTTLIRWPNIGDPTRQTHIKQAKSAVLKYKCKICADGNLLTKEEVMRHGVEHTHSMSCEVGAAGGCRRRFCVGRG